MATLNVSVRVCFYLTQQDERFFYPKALALIYLGIVFSLCNYWNCNNHSNYKNRNVITILWLVYYQWKNNFNITENINITVTIPLRYSENQHNQDICIHTWKMKEKFRRVDLDSMVSCTYNIIYTLVIHWGIVNNETSTAYILTKSLGFMVFKRFYAILQRSPQDFLKISITKAYLRMLLLV